MNLWPNACGGRSMKNSPPRTEVEGASQKVDYRRPRSTVPLVAFEREGNTMTDEHRT